MKKLSFKEVAPERILDYEAMSHIKGGIDDGYDGYGSAGTCGMKYPLSDGRAFIACNISKKAVEQLHDLLGGGPYSWCCDSCSSTDYCGDGSGGY